MNKHYDYIIVGGGSAGCVLASRLSEDKDIQVLLIEAGAKDGGIYTKVPLGYGKTFYDSTINWMYQTQSIPGLNNRSNYWPRGKLIGGSSAINAMLYVRGHSGDFDDWDELVGGGWSYAEVLKYFKKSESHFQGESMFHGGQGPMRIEGIGDQIHPLSKTFLSSCESLGYKRNSDFNGQSIEGCGSWQITRRDGYRESAATAFLHQALKRSNLTVLTRAMVKKVIFLGLQAYGVEVVIDGGNSQIFTVSKEVILSAGAINTPKLLELSGVGDGALLNQLGIPVIANLPSVGENLQDHLALSYFFKSTVPTLNQSLGTLYGKTKAAIEYAFTRKGLLSMSVNQVGGFVKSRPDLLRPNLQLYFNPISYDMNPKGKKLQVSPDKFPGFLISFNTCKPTSVGSIHIAHNDYLQSPLIQPNYLSTREDLDDVFDGYRIIRQIAGTKPLSDYVLDHHSPKADIVANQDLLEDFRNRASTVYHACGTAAMGSNSVDSVVDSSLRVHGLKGLRVVDASVFPIIPTGNTNAPTIMVAEKAADMIKKDWA